MTIDLQETLAHDFAHMRQKARWQQLRAQLTGDSITLLDYDTLVALLGVQEIESPFIAEIALDDIRGSVGRAQEFTNQFYPRNDGSRDRWIGVKSAVINLSGLRPIEVYQIDDVYFVQDGNHRVSVARQLGVGTISARVTRVRTMRQLADLYAEEMADCWEAHQGLLARVRHWLRPQKQVKNTAVVCHS